MDIIDQVEIPTFKGNRRTTLKRTFPIAAGCVGILFVLEQYNGCVSRTWKSVRRGVTAALAAWLEDHGEFSFLEGVAGPVTYGTVCEHTPRSNELFQRLPQPGEEPPTTFQSVLDINGHSCTRLSHDRGTGAAAAAQRPARQERQQQTLPAPGAAQPGLNTAEVPGANETAQHANTPNFFQSTKFFACLDVEEARELFMATKRVVLAPHEVLFRSGDPSDSGIFIVLHGSLGVFLEESDLSAPPIHANTLRSGESVGDLDVVDGAARTVSCMALESGCTLVNVSRPLFMEFVRTHPRALMLYLQQGLARLWRVAHFVMADFLQLQLYRPRKQAPAAAQEAGAASGGPPLPRRTQSCPSGQGRGPQTDELSGEPQLHERPHTGVGPGTAAEAPEAALPRPSHEEWNIGAPAPSSPAAVTSMVAAALPALVAASAGPEVALPAAAPSEPLNNELPLQMPPEPGGSASSAEAALLASGPTPGVAAAAPGSGGYFAPASGAMAGSASGAAVPTAAPASAEGPGAGRAQSPQPPATVRRPPSGTNAHSGAGPGRASWVLPLGAGAAAALPCTDDMAASPEGPVCRRLPDRLHPLHRSFVLEARASLAGGWDVIGVEEAAFEDAMWAVLSDPRSGVGSQLPLAAGGMLQDLDWASGCFYLLLDGHLLAERPGGAHGGAGPAAHQQELGLERAAAAAAVLESGLVSPGSLISCAAFLSSTPARCKVVALEPCRLVAFSWQTLEWLLGERPQLVLRLLVAASAALGPVIRRFISLGLNRVWLESGDVAYSQGDFAECLYVVISGRLRLLHETHHPVTQACKLHLEEEVGRGEAVGAVWAITGGKHDTTALCVRDSELVRMSRSAFRVISADSPLALSKLFSNIARRLMAAWDSRVRSDRGSVTSSGSPEGGLGSPTLATHRMGNALGAVGGVVPELPHPSRFGLTPLKSAGHLAADGSVVRRPHPSGLRGEMVTIAILPAGTLPEGAATAAMVSALAGSPTDVAAAAAALAAAEAASMGGGGAAISGGTGSAGLSSTMFGHGGVNGAHWRCPPGMTQQAAGLATLTAIKRLSGALKDALSPFGPVLLLDATVLSLQFPTACERLHLPFYRSKVTSWMAAKEEEYRFIVLEADVAASPWSSVCVAQADCILLVAPEGSTPALSQPESRLVFNAASPAFARSKPPCSGLLSAAANPASTGSMTPVTSVAHLSALATAAAGPGLSLGCNPLHVGPGSYGREGEEAASSPYPPGVPPLGNPAGPFPHRGSSASSANLAADAAAAATGPYHVQHPCLHVPFGAGPSMHPCPHMHAHLGGGAIGGSPAMLRRVELVLLHSADGSTPARTAEWLARRPNLSRHHHIRLSRAADIQRLARWVAGKAVGIVLSGGGCRGLAHLGVLTALEDAGVPVDAMGGTGQGAFMAALYAQGLGRDALQQGVRHYAARLGSVCHLLADMALPLLSLLSGAGWDEVVRKVFERGAQRLEDLWLPYFCVTTNLTRGEASVHMEGLLWKLVRASMTVVGMLPPVWEGGCMLVDGGYMNPLPVDVMRGLVGVESVLVVDVEGRDDMGWRTWAPYDGGLSGWRLLWDRWCPVPSWRFSQPDAACVSPNPSVRRGCSRPPRTRSLLSKLSCMSHAANLRRVAAEHRIDLYLRPPAEAAATLLDPHTMDRIVKDAYRYATSAVTQWKGTHRVGPFGIEDTLPPPQGPTALAPVAAPGQVLGTPAAAMASAAAAGALVRAALPAVMGDSGGGAVAAAARQPGGLGPCATSSCMSQLQKKQQSTTNTLAAATNSLNGSLTAPDLPYTPPLYMPLTVVQAQHSELDATFAFGPDGLANHAGLKMPLAGTVQLPVALRAPARVLTSQGLQPVPPQHSGTMWPRRDPHSLDAGARAAGGSATATTRAKEARTSITSDEAAEAGVVPSPPSRGMRRVASRMSRSTTRHSLLDLQ